MIIVEGSQEKTTVRLFYLTKNIPFTIQKINEVLSKLNPELVSEFKGKLIK